MRPLVLLWGCLVLPGYGALVGPKEIRAFEGDTVSLQCTYGEELRKKKKYWCRKTGLLVQRCSGAIYTEDGQEKTEGRVSIQDRPQELTFSVTLRKLTLQDTGKYLCGVTILGLDKIFMVSLIVLPGPCCPPSHTPSFQPLATTSLQTKAKAWQTQLPELRTSSPARHLDSTPTEDTRLVPSSSNSKSRKSLSMVRILAPVLVLLSLLLATGLTALVGYMFQWRKKAQLAMQTQKNEKVHLSHLPLGNGLVPEYAVINLAAPMGPCASLKSSASPYTEIQCLSQPSEEEEASFQHPERDMSPRPPPHMCEELSLSKFILV
ncbi:PREDICTED: CMRF35-like molecule 9 isoform X6 [Hipposideros armiger]|uniref:CMRF35-like molecule 9 isoform X6 n=1 Tax=Hipposideros armiger TaxID=186990 RepID=A0A8B7T6B1_HIPAR|nr:PREDICTED: CMRF35-like molecule 9 isoform X6 [Hipposideros armiger]